MKIDDLLMALEFVSFDGGFDHQACVCRETGEIFYSGEDGGLEELLPEDLDSDRYVGVPDQRDFNLGRELVLRFADEYLGDDSDKVRAIFTRPGAYRRFKDLLEDRDMLDKWNAYEQKAYEEALRQWCHEVGLTLED